MGNYNAYRMFVYSSLKKTWQGVPPGPQLMAIDLHPLSSLIAQPKKFRDSVCHGFFFDVVEFIKTGKRFNKTSYTTIQKRSKSATDKNSDKETVVAAKGGSYDMMLVGR